MHDHKEDERKEEELTQRTKAQLNQLLSPHGWEYVTARAPKPGLVEYELRRVDGRVLHTRVLLAALLQWYITPHVADAMEAEGLLLNPLMGLHLLAAIKKENKEHPLEKEVAP